MSDYVIPKDLVQEATQIARTKSELPVRDMLIRGILAGAFLGYATALVFTVLSQGLPPIVGAIVFPVGFVILVLLGLELVTGNFALLPAGLMAGTLSFPKLARNLFWVYLGNLIGSLLFALLFFLAITNWRTGNGGAIADLIKQAALKKTTGYSALGLSGWGTVFIKAILCNWMVTVGAMMALVSRSALGKIAAMWLPIMTFFALGFEHSVVNMFLIPSGMILGAPISVSQFLLWNLLPVTLGNFVAGALFTGVALYITYPSAQPYAAIATPISTTAQSEPQAAFAPAASLNPM
ncbi:MAG TPA: formate/nitrite transporter family protein [Candidatus Eisenbacteria bacterium]|jgi:formate/nitrite transporter|nr:formate/nitrite transporter family protein [Candidatus Eisenbacteria bacterium]